jgi:GNAT superfamily N-acetyltransferase
MVAAMNANPNRDARFPTMPIVFRTRRLEGIDLAKAHALVLLSIGDHDASAWLRFAIAYSGGAGPGSGPCGVIGVEDCQGYVLGFFCFRVLRPSPSGAVLDCDHFVVPDLVRSGLPFAELTSAAEALAREHGCDRIRLAVPGLDSLRSEAANRFRSTLYANDYQLESLRFEKKLETDLPAASSRG